MFFFLKNILHYLLSKISMMCMHYFHNQEEIIQTIDTFGGVGGKMEVEASAG